MKEKYPGRQHRPLRTAARTGAAIGLLAATGVVVEALSNSTNPSENLPQTTEMTTALNAVVVLKDGVVVRTSPNSEGNAGDGTSNVESIVGKKQDMIVKNPIEQQKANVTWLGFQVVDYIGTKASSAEASKSMLWVDYSGIVAQEQETGKSYIDVHNSNTYNLNPVIYLSIKDGQFIGLENSGNEAVGIGQVVNVDQVNSTLANLKR